MLSVVCWRWGNLFSPLYVARLRSMLERHLHIEHQLYCVTDDVGAVDPGVRAVPMPHEFSNTPRCRRRMWQFARERAQIFGPRMLCIDLDVVIVDDITPIVDRREPVVVWRVAYAGVYSGSFLLFDTGVMHGLWDAYRRAPERLPALTKEQNASDQAMLNLHLRNRRVAQWTEADGIRTYFGSGYERLAHRGVGPNTQTLPPGTRIVVLGSSDKSVMDTAALPWIKEHWR